MDLTVRGPCGKAAQRGAGNVRPPAQASRMKQVEADEWAGRLHPIAFVWLVTGAEIDHRHTVAVDDMFQQRGS